MQIKIAERLKPFSHVPGTYFLLPRSPLRFQIFPALIHVDDLSQSHPNRIAEISVNVQGPVKDFTIQQDLERGILTVWGHTQTGFMRYHIHPSENLKSFAIRVEKEPLGFAFSKFDNAEILKPRLDIESLERLSLGSHKVQDWALLHRRQDLREIFPLWFRLGSLLPPNILKTRKGTASLLDNCEAVILNRNLTEIVPFFLRLALAGFEGGFSPRLVDDQFQGFDLPLHDGEGSPLELLSQGSLLIRKQFFDARDDHFFILPALSPEFHCGRFLRLACGHLGIADIEWSKKMIRRMIFCAAKDAGIQLSFQHDIKTFRLSKKDSKSDSRREKNNSYVEFSKGHTYFLDRFEK